MHSVRQVHRLAVTWDLVFDPATVCFYIGGCWLVLLAVAAWSARRVPLLARPAVRGPTPEKALLGKPAVAPFFNGLFGTPCSARPWC